MNKIIQAATSLAYHKLLAYVTYIYPGYKIGLHHRIIAEKLEKVEKGKIKRLIIIMPPRFGKSLLVTQLFVSWFLGKNKDRQVISTSYGDDLAADFGRKVRNYIETDEFKNIFDMRLAEDSKAIGKFATNGEGGYISTGIGGAITGRGADLLIIDDPIKNRQDADSETIRNKIGDWYSSVARTRLQPDASIIVIQTRWHKDDLVGRLLQQGGWEVVNIPAIREEKSVWEEHWSTSALQSIRHDIDPRDWWCLYQGIPMDPANQVFDQSMFHYWQELPVNPVYLMVVDPAFSKKKTSDYSCIMIACRSEGKTYIVEYVNEKLAPDELISKILQLYVKWKPIYTGIEAYAAQAVIGHYLKEKASQSGITLHYEEIKQIGSKIDKIKRLLPPMRDSKLFWKPFHAEIEKQLLAFPQGDHDDVIDAMQMLYELGGATQQSGDYLESIRLFYQKGNVAKSLI